MWLQQISPVPLPSGRDYRAAPQPRGRPCPRPGRGQEHVGQVIITGKANPETFEDVSEGAGGPVDNTSGPHIGPMETVDGGWSVERPARGKR